MGYTAGYDSYTRMMTLGYFYAPINNEIGDKDWRFNTLCAFQHVNKYSPEMKECLGQDQGTLQNQL
jgi:hypothetical protein